MDVVHSVRSKVRRLQKPKNLSVRPVLIHVNGVEQNVRDVDYCDRIVDFGRLAFGN